MEWIAIVWSGFVATILGIAFFWVARSFGWIAYTPAVLMGCVLIPDPRRPHTETAGFLILLLVGSTVVAALLRSVLAAAGAEHWLGGVVAGAVMGLAAAGLATFYGTISACVKRGLIATPDRFGIGWGRGTPAVIVLGHIVYGATFAAIHAGF